jgi:hypothetical protein
MLIALCASAADVAQRDDDHTATVKALAGIQVAIAEIIKAENATSSGPAEYKAASQRAIDALEGAHAPRSDGSGNASGAIGRIEHLLDRRADRPWEPVLDGVLVNIRAAVAHLQDAGDAHSLTAFDAAASRALENLEVAQGRTNDYGVLGGMFGAVANTELAVPPGASLLDGCSVPHEAGYGLYRGYLAYRAVQLGRGTQLIPASGGENIRISGNLLVIYTAAAPLVQQRCEARTSDSSGSHAPTGGVASR